MTEPLKRSDSEISKSRTIGSNFKHIFLKELFSYRKKWTSDWWKCQYEDLTAKYFEIMCHLASKLSLKKNIDAGLIPQKWYRYAL
jgi:hypothetical protein